jgi:flagellar export protein FliJ
MAPMSQRIKSLSRISRLIDHQKEVVEMEVLQIQKRLHYEKNLLADLEGRLEETIRTFEKDSHEKGIISSREMAYLYGMSSFLSHKIERQNHEVLQVDQELKVQEAILLAAYRKKKVFEIFKDKVVMKENKEVNRLDQKSQDFFTLVSGQGR